MSKKRMMAPQNEPTTPKDKKPAELPAKPSPAIPPSIAKSSVRSNTGPGGYTKRPSAGAVSHPLASTPVDSPGESLGDILVESDPDGGPMVIWFLGRPS